MHNMADEDLWWDELSMFSLIITLFLSISKQTSQKEKKNIIDLVSELNRVNGVGWENQL